jgi:hypothetical protein
MHMAQIEPASRHGRLPITDGRTAEARYLKRLRAELRQHIDGPSIGQQLLIDRIAQVSLRIRAMDCDPCLSDRDEYVMWTRLLMELLSQFGDQIPVSSIMPASSRCEVAA